MVKNYIKLDPEGRVIYLNPPELKGGEIIQLIRFVLAPLKDNVERSWDSSRFNALLLDYPGLFGTGKYKWTLNVAGIKKNNNKGKGVKK